MKIFISNAANHNNGLHNQITVVINNGFAHQFGKYFGCQTKLIIFFSNASFRLKLSFLFVQNGFMI